MLNIVLVNLDKWNIVFKQNTEEKGALHALYL